MSGSLSEDLASLRIRRDEPPPSRSLWRYVVGVLVAGGVALGALALAPIIEGRIFKVEIDLTEIATVSPAQASVDVTSTGYVIPQVVAKVGAKVMGRIAKVNLGEGDHVNAGQVIFELDPADQRSAITSSQARTASARAKVEAARANLAEVQVQYDREKKLVESGSAPKATVEDLTAKVGSLNAQVRASEAEVTATSAETASLATNLKNMTIVSPIDGIAMVKPAQIGDVVSPGTALVELYDPATLLVETDVPEARLHQIKVDGPCEIVLDSLPTTRLRGTVADISPRINRSKATATVKVKVLDVPERLRPDMSGRVSFLSRPLDPAELKEAPKTVVPASAVVDRGGAKVVFVYDSGKVRLTNVALGPTFQGGFELQSGPPPGTRIVNHPPDSLTDGQTVKEKSPS